MKKFKKIKYSKFDKVILLIILIITFYIVVWFLINCVVGLIFANIKFNVINWFTFWKAFGEDYSLKWSFGITTIIFILLTTLICYKNWKNFNFFAFQKRQDTKKIEKEFNQIPEKNLIKLDNHFGLNTGTLNQHTLLVGTTGSGKTATLLSIIKQLNTKLKQTTIIIDGKGDVDLINKIKTFDSNSYIWKIDGSVNYNPFSQKDPVVLTDKIMSLFEFSEPFYKDKASHFLKLLINILIEKNIPLSLKMITNYYNIDKILKLITPKHNLYQEIKNNFEPTYISGLYSKLANYNLDLINSFGENNSLLEIIKKHKTILFSINSLKYHELAIGVGKIIIQDLKELTSIKDHDLKINIVMDEFNVFADNTIINLLNKTRSFNFQCFLSFQTNNDLKLKQGDITDTIYGNVNNIICHKVNDPNTAEYIASVFGTRETEKLTRQIDYNDSNSSKGSIRIVDEFIVHPNEIKNLKIGQCFLKTPLPNGNTFIKKITVILQN